MSAWFDLAECDRCRAIATTDDVTTVDGVTWCDDCTREWERRTHATWTPVTPQGH